MQDKKLMILWVKKYNNINQLLTKQFNKRKMCNKIYIIKLKANIIKLYNKVIDLKVTFLL